jgi:hypothetical protein
VLMTIHAAAHHAAIGKIIEPDAARELRSLLFGVFGGKIPRTAHDAQRPS